MSHFQFFSAFGNERMVYRAEASGRREGIQSRFLENARPDPDLGYFFKSKRPPYARFGLPAEALAKAGGW